MKANHLLPFFFLSLALKKQAPGYMSEGQCRGRAAGSLLFLLWTRMGSGRKDMCAEDGAPVFQAALMRAEDSRWSGPEGFSFSLSLPERGRNVGAGGLRPPPPRPCPIGGTVFPVRSLVIVIRWRSQSSEGALKFHGSAVQMNFLCRKQKSRGEVLECLLPALPGPRGICCPPCGGEESPLGLLRPEFSFSTEEVWGALWFYFCVCILCGGIALSSAHGALRCSGDGVGLRIESGSPL